MSSLPYYLGFSYMLGIGPLRFNKLLHHFESVEKAYKADRKMLDKALGTALSSKFVRFRNEFDSAKELNYCKKHNITVLTREHECFPKQLLHLEDAPICLYVKGEFRTYDFDNDLFFGIVGTRKPTHYGQEIAKRFAYTLASEGMIIVSGMALGIDAIAHRAALQAGSKTIAFLGCGVHIPYPPTNRHLYREIVDHEGLVISEVPPQMRVQPGLFIQRNRLISGLSKGVLIAEGLKNSGSLITARFAAEQGKDVFAPPAPITSEYSDAPNILLKEGATFVTSPNDILEEYSMSFVQLKQEDVLSKLSTEEQDIYKLLAKQPLDSDEIARELKQPVYLVLTVLSSLELNGVVSSNGSVYSIRMT